MFDKCHLLLSLAVAVSAAGATHGQGVLVQVNHFLTGYDQFGIPLLIPSIDPAGVAYHEPSGRLFIADSEIDEVPEVFSVIGANIFEVSLSGDTLYGSYDLTALGNVEPTGITYNDVDGHFYVTNDNTSTISRYSFVPGTGFTLEDEVSTLLTAGAADPEGITRDSDGLLYAVDGTALLIVVYSYDQGGAGFIVEAILDLAALNLPAETPQDPEGIAFDLDTGHLFLVSEPDQLVFEYTTAGIFVASYTYDLVPDVVGERGLTFAPTSNPDDDPFAQALFFANGGIDNDVNPNERDGAIYEVLVSRSGVLVQDNYFLTGYDEFGIPLLIPSIDPAGIAYHEPSGHLFIADSEINEVPEVFSVVGANVFEVSLSGDTLYGSYDLTALGNDEPTGITFNVLDEHFYVTNDDARTISRYSFVPGTGFTLLDEESTLALAGSSDPEGITSDPAGFLYTVDGIDATIVVYRYSFGGSQFIVEDVLDLAALNTPLTTPVDPEGIAFDTATWHLFVVSDFDQLIYEFTTDGIYVASHSGEFMPPLIGEQGLTFAPTSDPDDNEFAQNLYIADGGIDNDEDPNERDGAIYEARICDSLTEVSILEPMDGWIVSEGTTVTFTGSVFDSEAGDVSEGLSWESDLDGTIGIGESFVIGDLSNGIHTITASAAGGCGLAASASVMLYVTTSASPVGTLRFDLELAGVVESSLSRCVTLELVECGGGIQVVETEVSFASALAAGVEIPIPVGLYSCITARDARHTLRRTLDAADGFGVADGMYIASFRDFSAASGANRSLSGGNLTGDDWVDIFDFGAFAGQWLVNYGSGDTTCATPAPHADPSGNGLVFTEDFTFIAVNFLKGSDLMCCEAGPPMGHPVREISVAELYLLGLEEMAVADLNGDGWLDELDLAAFANGARPKRKVIRPTLYQGDFEGADDTPDTPW